MSRWLPLLGVIAFLGVGGLVPTLTSVVMLIGATIGIRLQVAAEERYLMQIHGDAYRQYARHVGRFVPWFGRRR